MTAAHFFVRQVKQVAGRLEPSTETTCARCGRLASDPVHLKPPPAGP